MVVLGDEPVEVISIRWGHEGRALVNGLVPLQVTRKINVGRQEFSLPLSVL